MLMLSGIAATVWRIIRPRSTSRGTPLHQAKRHDIVRRATSLLVQDTARRWHTVSRRNVENRCLY